MKIKNLLLSVDKLRNEDFTKRRKFLINNKMTWDLICNEYVNHYLQSTK